jgi:hypothetical protein
MPILVIKLNQELRMKLKRDFFAIASTFAFYLSSIHSLEAAAVWKSAFTDMKNDCVVISSGNDHAPVDFFRAECKSFGGYDLFIDGVDLRYGPELNYRDLKIDLQRPAAFHDTASDKIEWIYSHDSDHIGKGTIAWKGMIYQLSETNEDGKTETVYYYSIKLDADKSCLIGKTQSVSEARDMIYNGNECQLIPPIPQLNTSLINRQK